MLVPTQELNENTDAPVMSTQDYFTLHFSSILQLIKHNLLTLHVSVGASSHFFTRESKEHTLHAKGVSTEQNPLAD